MIRKYLATFMTVILVALPAANSYAAPATEKSIRELMTLTGAGNLGVQAMQNMLPAMKQLVPQAPESFWTDVMKEVDSDELITLIIPIYKRHFTEEEIQDTIKFYKSPAGRKMIQALPQVMQESMAVGQQWGEKLAQRVIAKAKAQKPKSP